MSMTDPISDMLTRIRNGQKARMVSVSMPASKAKEAVARVLKDEGYITDYATDGEGAGKVAQRRTEVLRGCARDREASSARAVPGLRIYRGKDDLPKGSRRPRRRYRIDVGRRDVGPAGKRKRYWRRGVVHRFMIARIPD